MRTLLERARDLLRPAVTTPPGRIATTWIELLLLSLVGRDVRRCALCDEPVVMTALPSTPDPIARAPP